MSGHANLLQYYVALNWSREIVSDIDDGIAKFQITNAYGQASDVTFSIREQQLRMIEILDDLIKVQDNRPKLPPHLSLV